jgi:hypothetical protein
MKPEKLPGCPAACGFVQVRFWETGTEWSPVEARLNGLERRFGAVYEMATIHPGWIVVWPSTGRHNLGLFIQAGYFATFVSLPVRHSDEGSFAIESWVATRHIHGT